jgi:hypothetical protein
MFSLKQHTDLCTCDLINNNNNLNYAALFLCKKSDSDNQMSLFF